MGQSIDMPLSWDLTYALVRGVGMFLLLFANGVQTCRHLVAVLSVPPKAGRRPCLRKSFGPCPA